jgi:hypothetical protein
MLKDLGLWMDLKKTSEDNKADRREVMPQCFI